MINADNLVTIPKALLEEKLVMLERRRVLALDAAIAFSLALDLGDQI